ncbi:uncharacterized protein EV420DRAFT_1638639 [Desarmillaria tabescens]|uniref:Uncharacterized protein n=1 Tax=Armillaria tabescens TaxID=1929756 RepID=A0AA39NDQ7_ARMTA|nr:uncharacterized protein EV420DRAFT_1638639 [Desarmillaria tabescens]KAK0463716.1 hypothetical protein EV420DRAFT_1638639 [Desarmillaria tabescens]
MFSRYAVLSEDYDPNKLDRPRSLISKPSSVTSRPRKTRPRFQPGQICVVKESTFTPLSEALGQAQGPLALREGSSLTINNGRLTPVSSGKERPCIIMDPPAGFKHTDGRRRKGYFICVMATFACSGGDYRRLGNLLQRFVVPVEPNVQLLPDLEMDALKTNPAWRHPLQWAIAFVIYTEQPVRPFKSRSDGRGRRLPNTEYNRLAQHCYNQRKRWLRDTLENQDLRQKMFEELVDWKPDPLFADNASLYSYLSDVFGLSIDTLKSLYPISRGGSVITLDTIFENTASTYPTFTLEDFPPLPLRVCEVY